LSYLVNLLADLKRWIYDYIVENISDSLLYFVINKLGILKFLPLIIIIV
jgi:hypothetical protein